MATEQVPSRRQRLLFASLAAAGHAVDASDAQVTHGGSALIEQVECFHSLRVR